jgi:oligopeptidase A
MQYCKNREIREALYKAGVTRASEITQFSQGEAEWNNAPLIHKLLQLRQQVAKLLGYNNFAEVSLATKMAKQPQKVIDFITNIANSAKANGLKEIDELKQFSKSKFNQDLELWDISYISDILRQEQYNYSEQEVQLYFTLPTVLAGLFSLIEKLFNVKIVEQKAQVWHADVKFFCILDNQNKEVAYFYLDVYARQGKQNGAWMDSSRNKCKAEIAQNGLPIAYLICNFNKSADETKPSCITHNDVITLFHEFGHGLHHMLTKIEDDNASGINGVEWDAVELPSQFMENFCWDYETVKTLTKHIDSGEILPQELFNKILKAKNFLNGLFVLRQVTFSMLDMQAHIANDVSDINQLAKQINDTYHVTKQLDINRWANTFTHVFAGGYAAGYYSYHWAEVLSSDAFAAFEEEKEKSGTIINPNIGNKYLKEILQVGGSRPALESFIAFRGREPDISAFLRHNGLKNEVVAEV